MVVLINKNEIITDRLILKRFNKEDLVRFAEILGEDEVGRQLPRGRGLTYQEARLFFERINKLWEENKYGIWAVIEKESGNLIGHCGLNKVEDLDEIEVLYALSEKYWGRGYGTEAAAATVKYGLEILNLNKIIGLTRPENKASQRVLEKVGLKYRDNRHLFGMECRYYSRERGTSNGS